MRGQFGLSLGPGGQAYAWAGRVSWWLGAIAALILFALVPHWYLALPVALLGFWLTSGLCGLLWYELREATTCVDRLHRTVAALTLILAVPAGVVAFCLVPNWSDFEFNGHPSLVAVAGSLLLGMLSFATAGGLVVFFGLMCQLVVLRFIGRSGHGL